MTTRSATGSAATARRRPDSAKIECHGLLPQPARKENPYRAGCIRFHGKARLVTSGPDRDKAWALTNHEEQSKDPEKKGAAVIIDLDLIEQIDSSVIMKKD